MIAVRWKTVTDGFEKTKRWSGRCHSTVIRRTMEEALEFQHRHIQRYWPTHTGTSKRSFQNRIVGVQGRAFVGETVSNLDYPIVIEKGRGKNKRWPPSKPIERWVKLKGLASGKEIKSVAFLIRRKIGVKGIKGKFIIKKAQQRVKKMLPIIGKKHMKKWLQEFGK